MSELTLHQVAVLSALMVEARELSNAELAELTGGGLTGDDRRQLVCRGLIEERRVGRSYAFELSAQGWSMGLSVLAEQSRGKGAAATTIRMLLTGLTRALDVRGVDARSFFGSEPTDGAGGSAMTEPAVPDVDTVEDRIRMSYAKLANEPAGWVSLADLRDLLDDIPRSELDTALKWMAVQPGVRLIPVANLKSLSTRERDAALRFGGEENHAFAIEGS
ncbi:MAG TPA: hypothetical protein VH561_17220 [Micromonosporaceae bacterium]|jgi:hypothetical protein